MPSVLGSIRTRERITLALAAITLWPSLANAVPPEWQNLSFPEFADLALKTACSPEAHKAHRVPKDLVDYAWQNYLSKDDKIAAADAPTAFRLLSAVNAGLTDDRRRAFAEKFYRIAFADSKRAQDPATLVMLGWTLTNCGWASEGQDFPEFAVEVEKYAAKNESLQVGVESLQQASTAVHSLHSADTDYLNPFSSANLRSMLDDTACSFYGGLFSDSDLNRDYSGGYFLAAAFGSDNARAKLAASLVDESGMPRLGVGKVLTWSYRRAKRLTQWTKELDAKAAASTGDVKSAWLWIRGIAEEARSPSPDPALSTKYFDQALAAATEEKGQLQIVEAITTRLSAIERFNEAKTLLGSFATRITDAGGTAEISLMREKIDRAERAYSASRKRLAVGQNKAQLHVEIRTLKQQIAAAKSKGDQPERIAALEQSLEVQTAKLDSPTTTPAPERVKSQW